MYKVPEKFRALAPEWHQMHSPKKSTDQWLSRCATWEEMCFIKDCFWDKEDAVMQVHPPESDYVSTHDYCLHLWRPVNQSIPLPPSIAVGHITGKRT
jgi:hypothetical protein